MTLRFSLWLGIVAVAAASLAACSAGSSSAPSVHAVDATSRPAASTSAMLRIVIPARPGKSAARGRAPKYISYATQSIEVVFTPSGGGTATTVTQNLTPTSPGCQGSLSSSTTCTLQLPGLAPGAYSVDFTLYDGTLDGNNAPTGNVLSANQGVPETIRAGQANVITVTLNGVPVAIGVLPGPASTLSGNQTAGYTLSSCFASETAGTERVTVVGLDADANIIVGPGAPTPALTSSDTSTIAVSTPAGSNPNAFALSGPATAATVGATVTLTASVTPLPGSPSTTPITAALPVVFVATGCSSPPPVATTVTLTSSSNPSVFGQPVTFRATVGVPVNGGSVAFYDGSNVIPSCAQQNVTSGAAGRGASCTVALSTGTHVVTAVYSGTANYNGSTSSALNQTVNSGSTSLSLSSSSNPSSSGQGVTFTAQVTVVAPSSGFATGTVTFTDNGNPIGGQRSLDSNETATVTTTTLAPGTHSITATYSGDSNFDGSSNTQSQVVF
jgi:hypothetical protein